MLILHSAEEAYARLGTRSRSVIAIGNFDGVHCGHRAILHEVRARARAANAQAVVVTFDPHPLRVLRPADAPLLITPMRQRLQLLAETGVDAALVLRFDEEFSRGSARGFAADVLARALGAIAVHEGDNFRFGYRAEADVEMLRVFGREMGFAVVAHSVLHRRGYAVSSSQVRALIAEGQVARARALLGRPFCIDSHPARGRGIGTRLLVPTINLAAYPELKPAHGVYVTRLHVGAGAEARVFDAVTNCGDRPTFGEASYAIESHLLNYDPEAAPLAPGEATPLALSFLRRIRAERHFSDPGSLKAQILRDVAYAHRYLRLAKQLATV